jgi:hypothetical protein
MRYQITSTGRVVIADQAFMDAQHPGDYTLLGADPVQPVTTISRYAFRQRFTPTEQAAIYTAAASSVQIQAWLDDVQSLDDVDLTLPVLLANLQALEAATLIAPGRAAQIVAP